jgi:predicted DNA-binding transcriptional regulator YafY
VWKDRNVRADRLVAMLLLLQRKGRLTAAEAAEELEISERTARRDLEALGMAGLPVYSIQGRNGGWALAGGGRTDLSGLTESEVRTIFLLAGPSSKATPELRAALRKLTRALPAEFRDTAEAASRSVVVDRSGWDGYTSRRADPPLLPGVQRAVVEGRQAVIEYVAADGASTSRLVHPLGLVLKGQVWYLIAETDKGRRTFRVDRVRSVEMTEDRVERPEGFDLGEEWRKVAAQIDERRSPIRARALASPEALSLLRYVFGRRVLIGSVGSGAGTKNGGPGADSGRAEQWVEVELRGQICGFGGSVEVLEPQEVRSCLWHIAGELADLYGMQQISMG